MARMYQDLPPAGDEPRSDRRELVKLLHAIAPGRVVTVIDRLCLPNWRRAGTA
jgi:hypothetical protein